MAVVYAAQAAAFIQYDGTNSEEVIAALTTVPWRAVVLAEQDGELTIRLRYPDTDSDQIIQTAHAGDWVALATGGPVPNDAFTAKWIVK